MRVVRLGNLGGITRVPDEAIATSWDAVGLQGYSQRVNHQVSCLRGRAKSSGSIGLSERDKVFGISGIFRQILILLLLLLLLLLLPPPPPLSLVREP